MGKEVEALEYHAYLFADMTDIGIWIRYALSIDKNFSRIEAFETVDASK